MNYRGDRFLGMLLVLAGLFIVISNSTSSTTGFVVFSEDVQSITSVLGIVAFVIGLIVFEEALEGRVVITTPRFQRAIKRHDIRRIKVAIAKIGTGLGHEEKLKNDRGYSIRVHGAGRVIFDYEPQGQVRLIDYEPEHEYERR